MGIDKKLITKHFIKGNVLYYTLTVADIQQDGDNCKS